MGIVLVLTSNRSTPCPPLVVPVDDRKRKRVVRVPGFTRVLIEPVVFRLKTRVIRDGFGIRFQSYPSTRL